jgi:hypothetical protein
MDHKPKTDRERQRDRTARLRRDGLKPVRLIVPIAREDELKGIAEQMVRESQEALQEIAYINTRIAECQYMIKYAEKHKDCESHMPQEWQEAIDKLLKKRNALSALIKEK